MSRGILEDNIQIECPLCNKIHKLEERVRIAKTIIKGEEVDYEEIYFFCPYCDEDENEYAPSKVENSNLLKARNAYRKAHDLLTSDDIVDIRDNYGLSQVDLARLLGWGEATISRYESKAIQDAAYDNMLRIVRDNPLTVWELLQKNGVNFSETKKNDIKKRIIDVLGEDGREYIQRKSLESEYIEYGEPCDENGMTSLDINKLELAISYYASRIRKLYKVKLMKMLWYADALFYKLYEHSITGLVYCHDDMGALPIGHYKIGGLQEVNMEEEFEGESSKYRFLPNTKLDEFNLTTQEREVLDRVIDKFKTYTAPEIIDYMHEEVAYKNTKDKEIIPFSLAKKIREF